MTLLYPPPFQDIHTLAENICASEHTIENWVKLGLLPEPLRVGGKRLWRWKDVDRHLAALRKSNAQSTPPQEAGDITNATRAAASKHN